MRSPDRRMCAEVAWGHETKQTLLSATLLYLSGRPTLGEIVSFCDLQLVELCGKSEWASVGSHGTGHHGTVDIGRPCTGDWMHVGMFIFRGLACSLI